MRADHSAMGKIDRAIEPLKASWGVIRNDKELLVLPAISGVCALGVIAMFAYPVITMVIGANEAGMAEGEVNYPPGAIVLAFVGYLLVTFIGMFFNCALIHAANERMEGGEPTLSSALQGASERIGRIFVWALVASTVSIAINQLQERMGLLGRFLAFLAGTAWAVVTFLVLPILVLENVGPVESVKRSAALLKRAWGEGLAGHIGLGILNTLLFFGLAAVVVISGLASPALLWGTIPLAVAAFVVALIVMSALSTVFQTALYRHAMGLPVTGFDQQLMANAFTFGKNGSGPARPSKPSDLRFHQQQMQNQPGYGVQPEDGDPFQGPQDWSKLPDQWT